MHITIKSFVRTWLVVLQPKAKQWLWFIILWCSSLLAVFALTYPLKFLINIVK